MGLRKINWRRMQTTKHQQQQQHNNKGRKTQIEQGSEGETTKRQKRQGKIGVC